MTWVGHALWIISFFTLWFIIIWIQIIFSEDEPRRSHKRLPVITIGIPAYNESKTLEKTVKSIIESDYPKEKVEIIIVDDGSKDDTHDVAKHLQSKYHDMWIRVFSKKNGGKASAVNKALENAEGELFAVVDADSRINPDCMKLMVPHFDEHNVAAVISRIKVDEPKTLIEKMQRFEYIMSNMIRNLMAKIGTLALTPGVLSVYRTELVKKVGGFDENRDNLTEDLEIAMRLKYNGYDIKMETKSITHTLAPNTVKKLWNQRIRWSRGFVYNHWKYKTMFFSKSYSTFGVFQMPANVLVVLLLVANVAIIGIMFFKNFFEFLIRSITIEGYFVNNIFSFPTLKEMLLGQNFRIMIPIILAGALGFYLIYLTHKAFKEKVWKHLVSIVSYFLFLPYFTAVNWLGAITHEVFKTKKKW